MSDELAMPEAPIRPPSLPFYEVWNIALRRPTLESYERLLQDPNATLGRAVVWLLVVGAISGLLSAASQFVWMQLMGSSAFSQFAGSAQALPQQLAPAGLGMAAALVCAIPISAIAVVLGQMLYFGLVHFTASAFGGQGTFSQMMYANTAYYAPITLISSLLSLIPCAACLAVPLADLCHCAAVPGGESRYQAGLGRSDRLGVGGDVPVHPDRRRSDPVDLRALDG